MQQSNCVPIHGFVSGAPEQPLHLQGLSEGRNCTDVVDDGDDVLLVDEDDGLLQSVADDTEKECSAQLLDQLFAASQPTLGKLNIIYYMAG